MKRFYCLLLLLLALLGLSGCSPSGTAQPEESSLPTVEPAPTEAQPSLTPTLLPSATPLPPSQTPLPTLTASLAPTSTPTALACWKLGGYYELASLDIPDLRYPRVDRAKKQDLAAARAALLAEK